MIRRFFPGIRVSELSRFRFFFTLAALLFSSQAVAMTVCESLLLTRLGIEALPYSVLAASALTLVCSYLYGRWVGGTRHENSLLLLVVIAVTVIGLCAPFVLKGHKPAYVAVFAFHFVTFTIFSQHLQALAGDYFDTLSAKRVLPLVGVGATVGEIAGGFSASFTTRLVPVEGLLALWAALLLAAAFYTLSNRGRLRLWRPETEQAPARTAKSGSQKGLLNAPLARALTGAVCTMIFTMSLVQYVVSDVFISSFPSESELASFLGIFVACSNILEMLLASRVTPLVLRRLGVAKANTIHSILALLTLALLWSHYTLLPAILAWMNRKTVHDALAGPVRRLVFNALPTSQRVATMAFVNGVAGSAARAAASLFLLVLQGMWSVQSFVLTGLVCAILYLLSTLKVAREYLRTLMREIGEGQFQGALLERSSGEQLSLLWETLKDSENRERLDTVALQLANCGLTELLERGLHSNNDSLRSACLGALGKESAPKMLRDTSSAVRLRACRLLWREPKVLEVLCSDPCPEVAEVALAATASLEELETPHHLRFASSAYLQRVRQSLQHAEADMRAAAVERLAGERNVELESIFSLTRDPDHQVREAAVKALRAWEDPLAYVMLCRCLQSPQAAVRRCASQQLSQLGGKVLPHLQPYFRASRRDVAEAAYAALEGVECIDSRQVLGQELRLLVREAWRGLVLGHKVEALAAKDLRFLKLTLCDRAERCRQLAFKVLGLLEGQGVVSSVMSSLQFSHSTKRATALELLSNLGDREAAELLVLLTEDSPLEERLQIALRESPSLASLPDERSGLLEQCLQTQGSFISQAVLELRGGMSSAPSDKLLSLSQFEVFAGLSLEELDQVSQELTEERFETGESILVSGEANFKLYLLAQGKLSTPHRVVGVAGALGRELPVRTVQALTPSKLWSLSHRSLRELILRQPGVSIPLLGLLSRRLKDNEAQLRELSATRA